MDRGASMTGALRPGSRDADGDRLNRTGFPGGGFVWFLRRQGGALQVVVVAGFGLGWRDVALVHGSRWRRPWWSGRAIPCPSSSTSRAAIGCRRPATA
jgi:hypothetical protein